LERTSVADPQSGRRIRRSVPPIDLLIALNYYAPYVSGLTDSAKVIAEGLAARGWRVTVVAARHQRELAPHEVMDGVRVLRTRVVARLGKGVISPGLPAVAARLARRAGVLNLHLPMLEAGAIALASAGTPLAVTYQCDVTLPPGRLNHLQVAGIDLSSRLACRRAEVVIPSSDDYAVNSRLWTAMSGKTRPISPPCRDRSGGRPAFRESTGLHVGFVGRIVAEKGLEYLVDAFLRAAGTEDRLLIAGDYRNVAGGSVVEAVRSHAAGDPRIRLLGFLPEETLADFYASIDVFALPSVNPLEAFGIVQVEAMIAGVPVIASDLPGVRTPVRSTGFGVLTPPRDRSAIAAALSGMKQNPPDGRAGAAAARRTYGVEATVDRYAEALGELRSLGSRRA
jgi:glycosyltransferase involved in cell wall biosynthesis